MLQFIFSVFLMLHGLVHLLYFGQSARRFELKPGLTWWHPVVIATALFSTMAYVLFWDGKLHHLPDQGFIAILINLAILVAMFVFQSPL